MFAEARALAQQACLLVVITAGLVLGGMALLAIVMVVPSGRLFVPVSAAGSAATVLAALAILAHLRGWRRVRLLAASSVSIVGLAVLLVMALRHVEAAGLETAVRLPSPWQAVVFVLLGATLAVDPRAGWRRQLWRGVGCGLLVAGSILLVLQWLNVSSNWLAPHPVPASLAHVGLLLFGIALLAAAPPLPQEPRVGMAGWLAGVLGVSLTAVTWFYLSVDQLQEIRRQGERMTTNVQHAITQLTNQEIQRLQRLQDRWQVFGGNPPPALREADIYALLRDVISLEGVAQMGADGTLQWLQVRNPRYPTWQNLLARQAVRNWLSASGSTPRLALLQHLLPGESGSVLGLVRLAPWPQSAEGDFLLGVFNLEALLEQQMQVSVAPFMMHVVLADGREIDIAESSHRHTTALPLAQAPLVLPFGPTLQLHTYLVDFDHLAGTVNLRQLMLVVGMLLSFLLVVAVELSRVTAWRNRELLHSQQTLEAQGGMAERIARGEPLTVVLDRLARLAEHEVSQAWCLIRQPWRDGKRMRVAAAPSVPPAWAGHLLPERQGELGLPDTVAAIEALPQGQRAIAGSQSVEAVPMARPWRDVWCFPVRSSGGELLGTVDLLCLAPGQGGASPAPVLQPVLRLVQLALQRDRDLGRILENEQRYRSLFTHNSDAVFALDPRGRFTDVNEVTCKVLGLAREDILGRLHTEVIEADNWEGAEQPFADALAGKPRRYELTTRNLGQRRVFDVMHLPIVIGDRVIGVHGIAKDITPERQRETELQLLLRSVEASRNGIVIADARSSDLPIEYANPAFERITGYSRTEILGRNCRVLQGPGTSGADLALIREALAARREVNVTLLNYRKSGEAFWNDLSISPVRDEQGDVSHFIGIQNDISNLKAQEAQLAHHAHHDALTGLPNRALLLERLALSCDNARRHNSQLAVVFIDLDGFKPINDSLGHTVGDDILVDVACRLQALVAPGDTVARFGGDEFVVIATDLQRPDDVVPLLEKILQRIALPYRNEGRDLFLTASLGIVHSHGEVESPALLIQQADMAMYRAKEQGRNNYQWFTQALNARMVEQLALRHDLQRAIEHGQFSLHYQPMVDAQGRWRGGEALLRWCHPQRGEVLPGEFIALAEQTGQIVAIGHWVLRHVCRDLQENLALPAGFRVSLNLSPMQFHRPDFLPMFEQLAADFPLAFAHLEIEITEGVLMGDLEQAVGILSRLRELGMSVALDDFGTGFSSLSYLKQLPLDRLKIDRSFVNDVAHDAHDAAITHGIVVMAHQLGLEVVAEGVETEAQFVRLQALGCDLFQGFRFGHPVPLAVWRERFEVPDSAHRRST